MITPTESRCLPTSLPTYLAADPVRCRPSWSAKSLVGDVVYLTGKRGWFLKPPQPIEPGFDFVSATRMVATAMKFICLIVFGLVCSTAQLCSAANLRSGSYFFEQSWSQETMFKRSYLVNVPEMRPQQKRPVLIFLHGNGGNAKGAMTGFLRGHPAIAARFITVFPAGYRESWNIVSERSRANDREFIEKIVERLERFDNVQQDQFTIMGTSNGSALANQMAIECRLPNIRNYITGVSPLNTCQYDEGNFRAKGRSNRYETVATPMLGKRLMNISGTEDRLVPYRGGLSRGIPGKDGKLGFLSAEDSTFIWAKHMGYRGEKLVEPSRVIGKVEEFSYLDGDVIHYKVVGEGHGAVRSISEEILLRFLEGRTSGGRSTGKRADGNQR